MSLPSPQDTDFNSSPDSILESLVHEIKTPLVTIHSSNSLLAEFLPILINYYNSAVSSNLLPPVIQNEDLELIIEFVKDNITACQRISKALNSAKTNKRT